MRRIAFINEKGGSCKTTLAVNMASFFAMKKKRTLLIDMDPQGQVGKSLGIDVRNAPVTVLELLTDPKVGVAQAALTSRIAGLDLIVANKRLIDLPMLIANDADRNQKLQKKLAGVEGYDFIVVDSPPSLGALTLNIMLAVDEIVIPVSMTYFALDGCAEILDTVEQVRSAYGRSELRVSAVVPTLFRNTNLAHDILAKLKAQFGRRVAQTIVGFNVKIDEAQSHGKTIWEYAPASAGAKVLAELAAEIYRIKN
jgi:chromosome partitioning protein